ncbi:protein dachsous isoform X2 [Harmonia axyridis]|uniref:protein dachsous isoform X2 n=1 Tax=Harmonia axyridis TaxID=115357 RepID=UPI001E279834|nr:protein dachsous isoform X2 [Harmonia axyridis]
MMVYLFTTMLWLSLLFVWASAGAEHIRNLEISEGAPVGTRIGFIGDGASDSGPPYLIVPVGSAVETDLSIDQNTGEIRTKVQLDREKRNSYSLVAIPISGDNVKVIVKVLDENDNAPTFPTKVMNIEFSENTPKDVKRTLNPAKDLDLDLYNTQRYNIVSGNVNNAFRLSSHRERDGVLYLDLQINGYLDRETVPTYSLVIEALDGGTPPLRGEMTVNITIQDVNDNQPMFNQTRYFATVPENATIGTSVLKVYASDSDSGENGQIEYSINRRQSDRDNMFKIDPTTGLVTVNKPLDFETKELHELVIVAKDHGLQPLETTTFVSIRVTDVNDNQPIINVIFLSDDATPKISESAKKGDFVARISVNDPDSKTEYSNVNVTLTGGNGRFGLTTRDNIIYLMIVSMPLDREMQPNYTLKVVATDQGNPPLHASKVINLQVTDINDNPPKFERDVYYANVMEVSDPGTSVIQVVASDMDEGNNSAVHYSLRDSPETHSSWFQIDPRSGLITTRVNVDCETDPVPQLTVVATDNGFPPLSSTVKVLVTIHDVNDNEPIFDQSFYNVTVAENEAVGRCIFKISATDPDCGVNAMVNYTIGDGFGKLKEFEVRSSTGEICISKELDYETRNSYEFPVVATDRGGLGTTAMVKIQITDVDDNRPVFYPREYNVSLREGDSSFSANSPVVVVVATDADSGRFGQLTYKISAGNDAGLFRIDRHTGEIFVNRPGSLSRRNLPYHHLNISATDGADLKSAVDAEVFISVIDSAQRPPIFERARYTFSVTENVEKDTLVGNVTARVSGTDTRGNVRYSIYSGDPDQFFKIGTFSGVIRTANFLDHETKSNVLLNIQATSGDPPVYGHTQVNIEIEDVNDNAPEFESTTVRIAVPENVDVGVPIYSAQAADRDSGANGVVRYRIVNQPAGGKLFEIDPRHGHLTLTRHLDYEMTQRHTIVVTATDTGNPPLSANLTVFVDVQDFNDNPPVFERHDYVVQVSEGLPVNSQILQVVAVDLDTGNNARLTYRLSQQNNSVLASKIFGIFPNSGWIYLRENLDRETKDKFNLIVAATDNGTPPQTATARVTVNVLDTNDNSPIFVKKSYEFQIEENQPRNTFVGTVSAKDADYESNAIVRYHIIPSNSSFQINSITGQIFTKESLDRESKESYDIIVEAKDQGSPSRSARVPAKIHVLDVNDNSPEIVDPQEDVVSVREEQSPGTEVVKVRAIDSDVGENASITYSIVREKDSDGYDAFTIDPVSGVIRTRVTLDHEERTIYRLTVAATDAGTPPKQSVRKLRVGVLDLNDNRPTFTSSSLSFKVPEDAGVGHTVGSVAISESLDQENAIYGSTGGHVTYTLTSCLNDQVKGAFDIDRTTGFLIVAKELDRELQSKYQLEIRALDTSSVDNPQSSAITVTIEIEDVNDNYPKWPMDPITISINEDADLESVIHNFSAFDPDSGSNGDVRYTLMKQEPDSSTFLIDSLTGHLILNKPLDYENVKEYFLVVVATDQCPNITQRLSSSVTVRVLIRDVNDNAPKFVHPIKHSIAMEHGISVGMAITQVVATDEDTGENGRVTYILSDEKRDGFFSLGYDTGILTILKPLKEYQKTYSVNITAMDQGHPQKRSNLQLKLNSEDSEDSGPKFLNSVFKASASEDAAIGTFVTKVTISGSSNHDANLTFYLPSEVADDAFSIDSEGKITVANFLDREKKDVYNLPVYIIDSSKSSKTLFDVASLLITVLDVNDHAPQFKNGACYRLSVPENNEYGVIHTVTAEDSDEGLNGQITYAISGGNVGNKFGIDAKTGDLTAKSLDRESFSRYHLTILAHDRGNPQLQGYCNLTVFVEDQNDNDPKFDEMKYSRSIKEDIAADTSILRVHASDSDIGINSRIIYSLANESQWLFRIDNKTGIIYTAGSFDREVKSVYKFLVVATDSGKYNARSTRVPVTIFIEDVNDNTPIFSKYPFREKVSAYIQPGQPIVTIQAKDLDIGNNAEIVYSIPQGHGHAKFRINPNNGILTATQSLASENGQIIYIEVVATDKGNPSKSTTGLVEITVGDIAEETPKLVFQTSRYDLSLMENTEEHQHVAQVAAVRTDGRRQKISYSFGSGNEENIFSINSDSGYIQVKNSKQLDFEKHHSIHLVVEAKTDGYPALRSYCDIVVNLTDQNDNAPRFSQELYTASVWEENNKGTFVLQVVALDDDGGQNSRIRYHIVDGNRDNAFKIEPAFSGVLKTNIALDREIRDSYRLTVIATDEGIPQMTGTAKIKINILDVNDNHPTFPKPKTIQVPENTNVGNVLTTVSANDVDLYPSLTYKFSEDNSAEINQYFSIDRFSGKVTLRRGLDYESRQEFTMKILASDSVHIAVTTLTIRVTDVNDNAPEFSQNSYTAALPEYLNGTPIDIIHLNATDIDSEENALIKYSILGKPQGFTINSNGVLQANFTNFSKISEDIYLIVKAEDSGKSPLHSLTSVRVKSSGSMPDIGRNKKEQRLNIPENLQRGNIILKLPPTSRESLPYAIVEGNEDGRFEIVPSPSNLILAKPLDRETKDFYHLKISNGEEESPSMMNVFITVEDFNDSPPVFKSEAYKISIPENTPQGSSISTVSASDADLAGTPNSEIEYEITSGNDEACFSLEESTGVLKVNKTLDYDNGKQQYMLIIKACDKGTTPICSFTTFRVDLEDSNDNMPKFPVSEYLEFIGENEPVGTAIFTAQATDLDKGIYGYLNYSLASLPSSNDDSYKMFHIDSSSGLVVTNAVFDYEQRSKYIFIVKVTDSGGFSNSVKVRVEIEGKDEFYPQFTEKTYKFTLATSINLPLGFIVGYLQATDRDKGADGRVVYQLTTQHNFFKVNRTTGAVLIKKKLDSSDSHDLGREVSLVVSASSGRQGSLTNMSVVEIILDPLADPGTNLAINRKDGSSVVTAEDGAFNWAIALFIIIVLIVMVFGAVFVFLHMRNKRNKGGNKSHLNSESANTSNNYVDPSAFDTIPIRNLGNNSNNQNQFAPPKYDEIPPYGGGHPASSNSGAATTSELSGSEQSGSSGRGSAEDGEDGEDEEIRMINEGPLQRDPRMMCQNDDDNLSDMSVRNTQEYLARLGIVNNNSNAAAQTATRLCSDPRAGSSKDTVHHHPSVPLDSLNIYDEERNNDHDISNFYAKLNDVAGSDRASSTDEGGGVNPGLDHVIALASYGEVPTVTHQPSMNGSLSSIVHSEEELAGSYNWDYLLDWGPQYQPLAHVFSEIARLKDDTASVKSGASGNSSVKSKNSVALAKNVSPPMITSVAPRAITMPVLSGRTSNHHTGGHNQMHLLPRSPISHDASGAPFSTSSAMSPNFSPSLSPLATKSPSISPLVAPGLSTTHHVMRQPPQNRNKTIVETEMRL